MEWDTLTDVKSKFWIVKGRSLSSSLYSNVFCGIFESKPYQNPSPPPLPTLWMSEDPPFLYTWVKYVEPFYVKECSSTKSKKV